MCLLSACSTVGDKTGLDVPAPQLNKTGTGAVAGAAVGGGLGLIVGSTSGNAGEGLLVGSLAGGALGAGIGAKMQHDDEKKSLDLNRDTVNRQGERIDQQNLELQDLRQNTGDSAKTMVPLSESNMLASAPMSSPSRSPHLNASKGSARGRLASPAGIEYLSRPSGTRKGVPFSGSGVSAAASAPARVAMRNVPDDAPPTSRTLGAVKKSSAPAQAPAPVAAVARERAPAPVAASRVAKVEPIAPPPVEEHISKTIQGGLPPAATELKPAEVAALSPQKAPRDAGSCKDAIKEAEHGLNAGSDADRLFYLRRAARLCPTEPSYHVELGKLYGAIGKNDDAKYELRQAIDLDPNNQVARDELSIIENAGTITR